MGLLAAVALIAFLGGIALAPRWISGAYLNVGSAALLDAALDRTLDADTRAARLAHAESTLDQAVSWNSANVPALRNLGRVRLLRHDLAGRLRGDPGGLSARRDAHSSGPSLRGSPTTPGSSA